eukprot:scaffold135697_cov34-Tisochrysis_lutea.AAC.1
MIDGAWAWQQMGVPKPRVRREFQKFFSSLEHALRNPCGNTLPPLAQQKTQQRHFHPHIATGPADD